VPLTPQDIVRKEFREAFRGYNQADVDLFLDEVVEEFTRAYDENQKMKVRLAALQQEVARLREGRGAPAAAAAPGEDPKKVEAEIRTRVKRFLEEQLRLVESPERSPTVERMARELSVDEPAPSGKEQREPFWAGE
jgi:DivIVA domain-containing protein